MSALILPRRLTAQPQYAARIDTGNPLARGLVNLYSRGFDAAQNKIIPASDASQLVSTSAGMALPLSSSNYADLGVSIGPTGSFTYVAAFMSTGVGTSQSDVIALGDRATFRIDTASTWGEFYTYDGAGWQQVNYTTGIAQNIPAVVVCVHDGVAGSNTIYVYQSGVLGSSTAAANARSSGVHNLRLGLDDETARSIQGFIWLGGAFNRALSDTEARSLVVNPWQLYKAPSKRLWVALSSADVTLAISAVTGTSSTGTVASSRTVPITSVTGTGSGGTLVPNNAVPLSADTGTGSVGAVASSRTVPLTAVSGPSFAGNVSPGSDVTLPVTGVSATGSVGTLVPNNAVPLSADTGTGSVGTLAPANAPALAAVSAAATPGVLVPGNAIGVTAATASGSVGVTGAALSLALAGATSSTTLGSLVPNNAKALTGATGTGATGFVNPGNDVTLQLTGVSAAGTVGSLTPSGGDVHTSTPTNRFLAERRIRRA